MSTPPPHPVRALAQAGAGDGPVLAAMVIVLALQGAMLVAITRRFLLAAPAAGLEIASHDLWLTLAVGIAAAALVGVVTVICRAVELARLRSQAEVRELLPSLRGIPAQMHVWSVGDVQPELAYHLHYADACYTTVVGGRQRIVLGTEFGRLLRVASALARFKLAHEFSHAELGATATERWARIGLLAYVLAVSAVVVVLVVTMAFLEPAVVNGRSVAALQPEGIVLIVLRLPTPDANLLLKVVAPLIVVGVAALAIFVFSYFVLVRRELYHDLRAAQLTGDLNAGVTVHGHSMEQGDVTRKRAGIVGRFSAFFRCHPSPEARIRCLQSGDLLLVSTTIFPVVVGALVPSALLATDFLNVLAGDDKALWWLFQTVLIGLLIALGIRADGVRFALMLGRKNGRTLACILAYAVLMAVGAALVGVLLMLWFMYHFDHDTAWFVRNAMAQLAISARNCGFYGFLLCAFAFLGHLRMRSRVASLRAAAAIEFAIFVACGVGGFTLLSLRGADFVVPVAMGLAILVGIWALALLFMRRSTVPAPSWTLDRPAL